MLLPPLFVCISCWVYLAEYRSVVSAVTEKKCVIKLVTYENVDDYKGGSSEVSHLRFC